MNKVYAFILPDYATFSFVSSSKLYFGTLDDFNRLLASEDNKSYKDAFERLKAGENNIYVDVLYWKERFGEQAQIIEEKSFDLKGGVYNHINIYNFPYDVAYDRLYLTKYLIRFKRSYYIAYKVKIYSPRLEKDEMYLDGRFWGFPEMIKVIKQSEKKNDFMLENTLLEISKNYKQKEKAFEAFYNDSELDLRSFFNDIFGDG
ncbi:MAG: hypothetical protein E7346_04485 [Clostridiales bacterium]|nr:hypothetical protein [Clostridiales bacterium]